MNYKSVSYDIQSRLDDEKSTRLQTLNLKRHNNNNDIDELDVDPNIFFYIEEVLCSDNHTKIIRTLKEFEFASIYISRQYIPTFNKSKVPSKLVEFLINPNPNISGIVSLIICSLITPETPEYAEDLCENGFLQQCSYILQKQLFDFSSFFFLVFSLSNLASFSSAKCDLIFNSISVSSLAFYAQSKTIDQGCHDELLHLLVVLSLNNINESIALQLMELTQSIFSDFFNNSSKSSYYILQLAYIYSRHPQFYEIFLLDKSSFNLIDFLLKHNCNDKKLIYIIPILTNIVIFTDLDLFPHLLQICDFLFSEDSKIIKLSCRFIRAYINKYQLTSEDIKLSIFEQLMQVFNKQNLKVRCEIFYCIFDLAMLVYKDVFLMFVNQYNLFELFIIALESEIDEIIVYALNKLISLLSKYEQLPIIKEKLIEADVTDSLIELITTPNDNSHQIPQMAELIINQYFNG